MERDFCKGWTFYKENGTGQVVNLPHDAMLSEQRTVHCHNGDKTGYFPGGKYYYEKEFCLTEKEAAGYVAIRFGGVYRHATVLLDGTIMAEHRYGYTEFTVDLSSKVTAGVHKITVIADNSLEPNSRWYSGSGIYRPVRLITKPHEHIRELYVETISVDPAVITVYCDISDAKIEILDGEAIVAQGTPGQITIPGAKLWSAETPNLYTCRATWDTDVKEVRFGIRSLLFSAQEGFCVNGQRVLLRGGCIHHDNGILGACSFADAEERKVRILKECGYNAIRSAHNPCSSELLDACDRLGMYVLDEAYDGWYTPKTHHDVSRTFWQDYRDDLERMVRRDRCHPAVILYSIGNEVTEVGTEKGVALAREMVQIIHRLDPTRPVTCGVNTMLTAWSNMGIALYKDNGEYQAVPLGEDTIKNLPDSGSAKFNALSMQLGKLLNFQTKGKQADRALVGISGELDVLGLNYGQSRYDKELRLYPGRLLLGTETYIDDLPYNWKRVQDNPAVLGDFCWTAFDYLGEASLGYWSYPSEKGLPLLAGCGAVDILGCPDAINGFQQIVWGLRKHPVIAVQPLNHWKEKPIRKAWRFTNAVSSWTWPGCENRKAAVEVYSDAEFIELRCNGQKIARKRVNNFRATFQVKYIPGKLEAVAQDGNGKEISRSTLQTAGTPQLHITPEKTCLRANGQDLCYVLVELKDENGILVPLDDVLMSAKVTGSATLQGFGSARCITEENYLSGIQTTYQGRCLAVLRAGYEAGTAQLQICTEQYGEKRITVTLRFDEKEDNA